MTRIRLMVVLLLVLTAMGLRATPTPALAAGFCPGSEQDIINAISSAGAGGTVTLSCPSATTIYFDTANGHNGTGSPITISTNVTLDASGSPGTIAFDGGHTSQGGGVQLFTVNSGATLGLNHLTLQHGQSADGGAIDNNGGTVTITSSTLASNSASVGGAIFNQGTTSITNSTLSGNSVSNYGGAIYTNAGMVSIAGSTLTGNSASTYGGAISDYNDTVAITGSTLAGNSAYAGGAIFNEFGTASIGGSIIATSSSGGNCYNYSTTITDNGYNLTDSNGACGLTGSTDRSNTDPQLGPLQANGGPTQTMALASTSPAIDQIPTSSGLCSATDQRGVTRPDQGETNCDIGAFESTYTTTTLTSSPNPSVAKQQVTYTATVSPAPPGGTVDFQDGGSDISGCTSQPVDTSSGKATCQVTYAVSGTHQITALYSGDISGNISYSASVSDALTQTVNLPPLGPPQQVADCSFATLQSDLQAGGDYYYTKGQCPNPIVFTGTITISLNVRLTAQGNDIHLQSVNAGEGEPYRVQLLAVNTGARLSLAGLTLSDGTDFWTGYEGDGLGGGGGAIYNNGTVTVTDCTFYNNEDTGLPETGGGVGAGTGGGAIFNDIFGTMTITNSTFHDNFSSQHFAGQGGAISNYGIMTVSNSTFNHNGSDGGDGGAIYSRAINPASSMVTITNSTFRDNSLSGGAQLTGGPFIISGTVLAGDGGANCDGFYGDVFKITDHGYNLEDDSGAGCGFSAANHDIVGQNPKVDSLANNGGPTPTLALQPGSPAIDVIPTSSGDCPTTDQRGAVRPDDNESFCDIGAYESTLQPTSLSAVSGSGTFGGSATLTATLTSGTTPLSGKSVTFSLNGAAVCGGSSQPTCPTTDNNGIATLANVTLSGINAGSYSTAVGARFAGDNGYTASTATGALTVGMATQSISFGALSNHTYGDAPFTVSATASSGLPVSFSVGSTDQCTISGTTVTITGAGSCTVTASQGGNGNYNPAPSVSQTFTIAKAATSTALTSSVTPSIVGQSVTITAKVVPTTGSATPVGTVTFLDGTTTLASGIPLDGTGSATFTTTALAAGTHSITASYSGNANFTGSASSSPLSQQVRYTVKVLSTSGLTAVLQLQDYSGANVSASTLTVTAQCVVPYSQTPPTACGTTPIQTINKAFGFLTSYKGIGPAYSYSVNPHGLTKGQQYDLLVQADGDPIWHAIPFTD